MIDIVIVRSGLGIHPSTDASVRASPDRLRPRPRLMLMLMLMLRPRPRPRLMLIMLRPRLRPRLMLRLMFRLVTHQPDEPIRSNSVGKLGAASLDALRVRVRGRSSRSFMCWTSSEPPPASSRTNWCRA